MVCGEKYLFVSPIHLKTHGYTMKRYREEFPNSALRSPDLNNSEKFLNLKDEFKRLWLRGDISKEIKKTLKISITTVHKWRNKLKLPKRESSWKYAHRERVEIAKKKRKKIIEKIREYGALTYQECFNMGMTPQMLLGLFKKGKIKRARINIGGHGAVYTSGFLFDGIADMHIVYLDDKELAKKIIPFLPEKADMRVRRTLTYRLKNHLPIELIYWIYNQKGYVFGSKKIYKLRCKGCNENLSVDDKKHRSFKDDGLCLICRAKQRFLI